ncbi:TIM barrel protein [Candidatus Gracilibacteria bacterium]|nr:TIM barrel protein [Candidatus Gracilibacteria bacterium]
MKINYCMKATPNETEIIDRITKLEELNFDPIIEFHLSSAKKIFYEDFSNIVKICKKNYCLKKIDYIVHYVNQDGENNYTFDFKNETVDQFKKMLDFVSAMNSDKLVMHRCYGLTNKYSTEYSKKKFFEKLHVFLNISKKYNIKLLIENYGFIWLPSEYKEKFYASPLDHFFPYEIKEFFDVFENEKKYCGVILDIAHSVLSCNMYNFFLKNKIEAQERGEFLYFNEYKKKINKNWLKVEDFIFSEIDYFHFSDAYVWKEDEPIDNYLYKNENYEIGKGTIDYKSIINKIISICNEKSEKYFIMEIDPENNDYTNNISQQKSIINIQNIINGLNNE